jgi:hypothetical protein
MFGGLFGGGGGIDTGASQAYLQQALALQQQIYDQTRGDNAPWLNNGQGASNRLSDLLGLSGNTGADQYGFLSQRFGMDDFNADPGYQFRLEQGQNAVERANSARGNLLSGAGLKDMDRFTQGLASQEYGNAYNRFNNDQNSLYSRLMGVSGQGLQASGINAQVGMNYANQGSSLYGDMANLNLAGQVYDNQSGGGLDGLFGGIGNLASLGSGISGLTSMAGITGGYDPFSGITWNSGRYF